MWKQIKLILFNQKSFNNVLKQRYSAFKWPINLNKKEKIKLDNL